ncbi:MAG TPA: M20/M25/M40 family metallo-hydrolase [Terracidiphilus sp.]|nr:M20/M25/M40 family metallo-hydrolase [Terracidiphilus sp.]
MIRRSLCASACALAAALFLAPSPNLAAQSLTAQEKAMAASIDAHEQDDLALLKKIIDINSGTMNFPGVIAVKDVLAPQFESLGFKVEWHPMQAQTGRAGDLVAIHPCPNGTGHCGKKLLLIGHMDTVFEPSSPFQKYEVVPGTDGKVATGPGISDMKGGLVVMLAALRAMKSAGALDQTEIRIVLSGDEERVGPPFTLARKDLIDAGKVSDVALEFEPGGRIDGQDAISIARRSSITWHIKTTGISGHSSQIFGDHLGYGAIYELARIIDTFRRELPEEGLTYNVGIILGGASAAMNAEKTGGTATGKDNIVAPIAIASGDIRTLDDEQTKRTEDKMRAIVAEHLPKTDAAISFDESYPAMARTPAGVALLHQWNDVSVALGLGPVVEAGPMTRGAGDISFVAPYIPGLVGVGLLGEGAHAPGEKGYLDSLTRQAKRDAVVMTRLSHEPAGH